MKNLALALGLKEDANEQEIKDAAAAINCKIEGEKLVPIVNTASDEDDDEDDDKAKADTYGKNPGKHIHALHKKVAKMEEKHKQLSEDHKALKKEHAELKKDVHAMGKKSTNDKVANKVNALVTLGKVENTDAAKAKATERLEKDFELASDLYDALPEKKVNATAQRVTAIIKDAAKEHSENSAAATKARKDATKDTGSPDAEANAEMVEIFNDKGEKVGVGMTKRVSLSDAKAEAGLK